MSQSVFFAHANGFPSATYAKLFEALAPEYRVDHLEMHGHDPRFPVNDNWDNLVDELLHHLASLEQPVWGVGHSLGGVLHYHAALRRPELYRGVVMLDSPVLTLADRLVIRAAKRFGFIDRITPAGRTLGRREAFPDLEEARAYFSGKAFGKRKLAPRVSPGKSWEGVYGGLAASLAITLAVGLYRGWSLGALLLALLGAALVVFVSIVGDLTESMFKRQSGIKDSSNLLPGHGGVLDRIDSLTAAIPVFAALLWAAGWGAP